MALRELSLLDQLTDVLRPIEEARGGGKGLTLEAKCELFERARDLARELVSELERLVDRHRGFWVEDLRQKAAERDAFLEKDRERKRRSYLKRTRRSPESS